MSAPKILIGCDPELFLRNKETQQMISAWGVIPGDKKNPHPVPGGAIQVDGMAVEFNINPAANRDEFKGHVYQVQGELARAIPEGLELVTQPVCDFDPEYFASLPAESKVLGCEPDFDAYTKAENPRPDGNPPFRTASGHIHIGWTSGKDPNDPDHAEDCIEVVRQLDYYLGLPSTLWDKDLRRRLMYGKAGAHRRKSYGVEYRTPSNMWLTEPLFIDFVYNAAHAAVLDLFDGIAMRVKQPGTNPQTWLNGKGSPSSHIFENMTMHSQRLARTGLMDMYYMLHDRHIQKVPKVKLGGVAGRGFDRVIVDEIRPGQIDIDQIVNDHRVPPAAQPWGWQMADPAAVPPPPNRAARRDADPRFRGIPIRQLNDRELQRAFDAAHGFPGRPGLEFRDQVMNEMARRQRAEQAQPLPVNPARAVGED